MSSRQLAVFLVLGVIWALGSASGAAILSGVDWQADARQGRAELVLSFDAAVPDMSVGIEPDGLTVWLPGATADASSADPVRVVREDTGVRLIVDAAGARLDGVEVLGTRATVRLEYAAGVAARTTGYRLGIGDEVTVSVYRDKELSGDYPVSQNGMLHMPLVRAVPAAGLTEQELAARLREALIEFFVDPQVSVAVKSYQSKFIVVTDPKGMANRIALKPGMTLTDVLSEAHIALVGGQEVELVRTGGGETLRLSGRDLDAPTAPLPRDGDVLTVQEPDYVFVSGEVRNPQRIPYAPGLTLQQALTVAGGLTEWASKKEIRIQRQVNAEMVDEVVNLRKVEDRVVEDPRLMPGDIVLVRRRIL